MLTTNNETHRFLTFDQFGSLGLGKTPRLGQVSVSVGGQVSVFWTETFVILTIYQVGRSRSFFSNLKKKWKFFKVENFYYFFFAKFSFSFHSFTARSSKSLNNVTKRSKLPKNNQFTQKLPKLVYFSKKSRSRSMAIGLGQSKVSVSVGTETCQPWPSNMRSWHCFCFFPH